MKITVRQKREDAPHRAEVVERAKVGERCPSCAQTVAEHAVFGLDVAHRWAKRYGGLSLLVEGAAEILPGVRFDKPESIPRPIRAIMRAIRNRAPFSVVIEVPDEGAWRMELTSHVDERVPSERMLK